ncbi:hypothetical protein [Roseibium sp. Sym1]|uniref:hypothetical protein n=1 Tax=Roseibium sp. Sym1 TaxID=3016006 RepID=UPI0022B5B00E|nr:hypothetical protein [Roseibium sp. Sym1]
MTAVDLTAPVGRPLDLDAVANRPDAGSLRPELPNSDRAGFSFGDFIDVINPLQHIPGVAELYRSVTNDQISDQARKTGNALYGFALGGPVGLGAMLAYNALGDRLDGGVDPSPAPVQRLAETAKEAAGQNPEPVPVPQRKPETGPGEVPGLAAGTALLGDTVVSTGRDVAAVPSLTQVINREMAPDERADAATAASSVAYLDVHETADQPVLAIPNESGLNRLATHQSNHLPLDVLKALQERHAQRTASEHS